MLPVPAQVRFWLPLRSMTENCSSSLAHPRSCHPFSVIQMTESKQFSTGLWINLQIHPAQNILQIGTFSRNIYPPKNLKDWNNKKCHGLGMQYIGSCHISSSCHVIWQSSWRTNLISLDIMHWIHNTEKLSNHLRLAIMSCTSALFCNFLPL